MTGKALTGILMKRVSSTWTEIMATEATSAAISERAPGKISLLARRTFPTASPTASEVKLFECP